MEAILIPVKRLDEAKRRLARLLEPSDRRRLGLSMLADVLRATDKWMERYVVTTDPDAEAVGLAFGCSLVSDPGEGLNQAIDAGVKVAILDGVDSLLILPSDVPLVASDDIAQLFASDVAVAVAASKDHGTSALRLRPSDAIPPSFGKSSSRLHIEAASSRGLGAKMFEIDSLTLDIDEPSDLEELARSPTDRESVRVARELLITK